MSRGVGGGRGLRLSRLISLCWQSDSWLGHLLLLGILSCSCFDGLSLIDYKLNKHVDNSEVRDLRIDSCSQFDAFILVAVDMNFS